MKPRNPGAKDIPLNIVGGSNFGRYPKISEEHTYNMLVSDGWLVPYAGYRQLNISTRAGQGRGCFASAPTKLNAVVYVSDNGIFVANSTSDSGLSEQRVGSINTFSGDVFFAENEKNEIAICDKKNIYIYNYITGNINTADTTDFVPGYVFYQDGRFGSVDLTSSTWRLCDPANSLSWPTDSQSRAPFEEADNPVAGVPMPGKSNMLLLMGSIKTQAWIDVGLQLFPYQKNTYFNIDYGCVNSATIASNETMVVWLAQNSQSGPVIMFTEGNDPEPISTDGINFKLASLKNPKASFASLFKQDGHLLYQITFSDPQDDFTLTYDFNEKLFVDVCDQNMACHIAKKIVAFNNSYYFVSFKDGNLYELNSRLTEISLLDHSQNDVIYEIPRIRICKSIRLPDASRFAVNVLGFTLEQGEGRATQRIDLSISKDGGSNFGSSWGKNLNALAKRPNRLLWWNAGSHNDFTAQFRFWGFDRFVVHDGFASIYQ